MKTLPLHMPGAARAFGMVVLILALALVLAVAACDSEDDPTATPASDTATTQPTSTPAGQDQTGSSGDSQMDDHEPLQVVATTSIVADWARQVGGDRVEVTSLLPAGADPHTFQPGARDVAMVADADLVLSIGLSLEDAWLEELIHNASPDESRIVVLGEFIDAIEFTETGAHDDHMGMGHDDHDDDHDDHEDDDHDDHEDEEEHAELTGRLLIADGVLPYLSVLDLATEDLEQDSIRVAAPAASLYTSPSGRFAFAVARGPGDADDRVHILDGGVYLEEHGDHFDLVTDPVSKLTLETSDERPSHVSRHSGWTSIFHDATGRVALFEEHDLVEELNDYEPLWLDAGPQHGASIVLGGGHVMVTSNNPDYPSVAGTSGLPLGAEVRTLEGDPVYGGASRACPGLHGEAVSSHGVAFGCAGGVLFIHVHFGEYEDSFISNPADMNAAARIGTLWGHDDSEYFYGSASYRQDGVSLNGGFWMIDTEDGEDGSMSLVLPATDEKRVLDAAFDAHGEELFVLTYDGLLNVIHAEHGEVEETHELVEAFDSDTSPSFIVVGDMLYLSDRVGGHIIAFSLEHGEIEHEWEIDGEPRDLAFVGLGAEEADEDHGHDDDHDDDHADDHDDDHDEDEHDDEDEHGHAHDHGSLDPHFWFDPNRVEVAAIQIATRLGMIDPAGAATYTENTTAFVTELRELHAWTQQQVSTIPAANRILVTSHDAFSYFAVVYGFEIVGTVIPSGTTEVEPSAEWLAELTEIIEHEGVKAVFGENTVSERLARAIADETGARFFTLFSGALGGAGSGADTYVTMVRSNVEIMVEALS